MADYSAIADKLMKTWPARMAQDMWSAAKAPGNAYNSTPDNPVTTEQMIKPAADLAGGIMGTSFAAAPALRNASGMGIRAYHGSPYDFNAFDASKIGTGEGAQAYGHGLYFAENEGVAKSYRDALTDPQSIPLQFKGRPVDMIYNDGIAERWPDVISSLPPSKVEDFQTVMSNLTQVNGLDQVKHVLASLNPAQRKLYSDVIAPNLTKPDAPVGKMYEVNINADPNHFLDWDKPFAGQSDAVKAALTPDNLGLKAAGPLGEKGYLGYVDDRNRLIGTAQTGKLPDQIFNQNMQGQSLYRGGGTWKPDEATNILNKAGIPGIKYLDQGSRAAGDGSRNYVVFDPKIVDIMKKYGILGGALGGGAAAQSGGILGTPQGNM